MRVAAYTGGVMVPSARARVRQYIGPLDQLGIAVREYPLPWGNILPRPFALRPLWIAATAVSLDVCGSEGGVTSDNDRRDARSPGRIWKPHVRGLLDAGAPI